MKAVLAICLMMVSLQASAKAVTRAETKEAERKLNDLGYWTGPVDGVLDAATRSALIAFQKWEERPITGKLTADELNAIRNATAPQARDLGYEHVEVDIDRQILMLVSDDDRVRVLPVSTGNDQPFIEQGENSVAYTPRGRFVVYNKTYAGKTGKLAQFISPTTSAAAWRFTATSVSPRNPRVMAAFASRCSPRGKSAS